MQNIKINYNMKYTFRGNLPENQSAAQIYIDSGFMSYVTSKKKRLPDSNDKIQIKSGKRTDPVVASEFCKNSGKLSNIFLKEWLYTVIPITAKYDNIKP